MDFLLKKKKLLRKVSVNNLRFKKGECNNIKSQGMLVQFSQNRPPLCGYCSCSLKSRHTCCGTIRVIVELAV